VQDFLNGPMTESDMGHVTFRIFGLDVRGLGPSGIGSSAAKHGNEAEWGPVCGGRHGNEGGDMETRLGGSDVTGWGMTSRNRK